MSTSYHTPKARASTVSGLGSDRLESVAIAPIAAGETVGAFGGTCVDRLAFAAFDDERQRRAVQLDDDLFLVGSETVEAVDHIVHSCTPNCGMSGGMLLVALRDIAPGERLTYDFAMTDGDDYDAFDCSCGTELCRESVTGSDWMRPELQLRYRGHFSPYLARRISALVSTGAERRAFAL
jgi:uncharacterized protein